MKITFDVEPNNEERSKKTIQDLKERFKKRNMFKELTEEIEKNFKFKEELNNEMKGSLNELEIKGEC